MTDREILAILYPDLSVPVPAIARLLGIARKTVHVRAHRAGIHRPHVPSHQRLPVDDAAFIRAYAGTQRNCAETGKLFGVGARTVRRRAHRIERPWA